MKRLTYIEPLEDRVAPATLVNPYTVTYQNYETNSSGTQIQGDTVLVHISKPLFTSTANANKILLFASTPGGSTANDSYGGNTTAESLSQIDLQGVAAATGMNISVSVIPHAGVGNGSVAVGDINAGFFNTGTGQGVGNIALGSVYIQGSLGGITCGSHLAFTPSLQSLVVNSLSGASTVLGTIGNLNVKGDFTGSLIVTGFQFGSIERLTIGGSLTGDAAGDSSTGAIEYTGHIGVATIGSIVGTAGSNTGEIISVAGGIGVLNVKGNITGGSGQDSGAVFLTGGGIPRLTIGGSLIGGSAVQTGVISSNNGNFGQVQIGGSITGGSAQDSGIIGAGLALSSITVQGSVTGSSGMDSGVVTVGTILGSITVQGSVAGGSGVDSGLISAGTTIGKVAITGSVTGGTAGTAADSTTSAAAVPGFSGVIEAPKMGTVSVGGSLVGGTPNPSSTTSDGTVNATADTSGAILVNSATSITIGGSITGNGGPTNGVISGQASALSTSFGTIKVGGALTGGAGLDSGSIIASGIFGGNITSVSVGGNVTGGAGAHSGEISTTSFLTNLNIGGNLTGGSVSDSGDVIIGGALKTGVIKGNVVGGTANSATQVTDSGYLQANHIGSLLIQGAVTSGSNSNSSGSIANSGSIRSSLDIASLTIDGAITGTAVNPVVISAQQGPETGANLKTDLAIGSVTVDGVVSHLDLLAGYSTDVSSSALGGAFDGAAQIGAIDFLSTLSASNLVAGANPDSSGQFGATGVKEITPRTGAAGVLSSIANIIIKGVAAGDSTTGNSYGIVAESLGSISINGAAEATNTLTPGTPVAVTGNLFLLEPLLK